MFAPMFKDSVSLLSSLVTRVERAQVDEGKYFSSDTEITTVQEKTENTVEETQTREEEVWRIPEIPPPQILIERDDDWFLLWDAVPRETSYVPPGTAEKKPCTAFQNFGCPVLYFELACEYTGSVYYCLC